MAKCRYCKKPITNFDQDVCPHCGASHPIDDSYLTMDMTHTFPTVANAGELYKSHSRKTAVLLGFFLAPFGAMYFYLGFKVKGFIQLLLSMLFVAALGSILYFTGIMDAYVYALAFAAAYLFNMIFALHMALMISPKDAEGELLR